MPECGPRGNRTRSTESVNAGAESPQVASPAVSSLAVLSRCFAAFRGALGDSAPHPALGAAVGVPSRSPKRSWGVGAPRSSGCTAPVAGSHRSGALRAAEDSLPGAGIHGAARTNTGSSGAREACRRAAARPSVASAQRSSAAISNSNSLQPILLPSQRPPASPSLSAADPSPHEVDGTRPRGRSRLPGFVWATSRAGASGCPRNQGTRPCQGPGRGARTPTLDSQEQSRTQQAFRIPPGLPQDIASLQ
jgi:hypothetical protein